MTKTFKQIREQDYSWQTSMRQKHRGGTKGSPKLFVKKYSRDSTSGSLTDKQIQNLKKTWNDPSKIFTKDTEQFVKNMVKKLDNDSRYRLAKAGIKHISKLAESGDVPKDHEYGPSSRKRPAGKRGYTSSDNARTAHLKTVKKWSKKKRRQGDKEFASEDFKAGDKVKYVGDNPRYKDKIGTIARIATGKGPYNHLVTGILKGSLAIAVDPKDLVKEEVKEGIKSQSHYDKEQEKIAIDTVKNPSKDLLSGPTSAEAEKVLRDKFGYTDAEIKKLKEESPANATGTAVAGTGDDSSTVLVKKRKELQKRLMRRFSIKETLDRILPDPVETEDELTTRKNQLKELAKNRND